jgi:hypothetical protein
VLKVASLFHTSLKSVLQMQLCTHGNIAMVRFDEIDVRRLCWMHLDVSPNIPRSSIVLKLADFDTLTRISEFAEGAGPRQRIECRAAEAKDTGR